MEIQRVLEATLSADREVREAATSHLVSLELVYDGFVSQLTAVLVDEAAEMHIRSAAGLALKNSAVVRSFAEHVDVAARWLALDPGFREQSKRAWLQVLGSTARPARNVAGQVVAAFGSIELPTGQWPELIDQLVEGAIEANKPDIRQAALQTLGFVCEAVAPTVLQSRSNQILTVVVGAARDGTNAEVQQTALTALLNALESVSANFEREEERSHIMQVVCEATLSPAEAVKIAAFECLVRIMGLYYSSMQVYMEAALFNLTATGIASEEENVALQAVEFWSTVAEEEIDAALCATEAFEIGETPEKTSFEFCRKALPIIVPALLQRLVKEDEEAADEWTVSMAAGTCLGLLSSCVGDEIVPLISNFVGPSLNASDWQTIEAGLMAFGSMLNGPKQEVLLPVASAMFSPLVAALASDSIPVRDTAAWAIGRVCENVVASIDTAEKLSAVVAALITALDSPTRAVTNVCWAFSSLATHIGSEALETCPLSAHYEQIIHALIATAQKRQSDHEVQRATYEALGSLTIAAPADCLPLVSQLIMSTLTESERLLEMRTQLVGADDVRTYEEIQSAYSALIFNAVRRAGPSIQPLAERIVNLELSIIRTTSPKSPALEDAFAVISALVTSLEAGFAPYVNAVVPFVTQALGSHDEHDLYLVVVGLVGDICRVFGTEAAVFTSAFVEPLLESVKSARLNRDVKPHILSCFGDIAISVGGSIDPYVETIMAVLSQAGDIRPDKADYSMVDYVQALRDGIADAYVGLVNGLVLSGKTDVVLNHAGNILNFCKLAISDTDRWESVLKTCLGLIGDLAATFKDGKELNNHFSDQWFVSLCKPGSINGNCSPETKRTVKWMREMVRKATK